MSDEIGNEFDRALRTALMGMAQMGERVARRQADRERQQTARLHQEQMSAQQAHRDLERGRESMLRSADRVWLDERDAARMMYRPFTQPGALDRATPEQAATGWEQARFWAEQDPFARASERTLREAIVEKHGQEPQQILDRAARDRATPKPKVAPMSVDEARAFASEHAPPYYTRHVDDRVLGETDRLQLQQDMVALRDTGAVPIESRKEEWARWSGEDLSGLSTTERAERLDEAWAAGVDERGALELSQGRPVNLEGNADTTATDEQLRAVYAVHLDLDKARDATDEELARSWQAASVVAARTPSDDAAAEQLRRQFEVRHGTTPSQWARSHENDRGRGWLLHDVLADRAAEYGDRIDAANARASARQGEADGTHPDPDIAAHGEHRADVERRASYVEEATAELWHGDEQRTEQLRDADEQQGEDQPYDRADESNLNAAGVTHDGREAVIDSSHGFSQPTATMVAKAGRTPKNRKARKTTTARGAEHSAERSRGR